MLEETTSTGATVAVYLIYLAVAVGLVVWLARTLYRNGQVFLDDVFEDKPQMAAPINKLLVTGFYMLNLGYAALLLRGERVRDVTEALDLLTLRFGVLLVSLAIIHFLNLWVFAVIRRHAQARNLPPAPPQPWVKRPLQRAGATQTVEPIP